MERITYDPPVVILGHEVHWLDRMSEGARRLAAALVRATTSKGKYIERDEYLIQPGHLRDASRPGEDNEACRLPFGELLAARAALRTPTGELWEAAWLDCARPKKDHLLFCVPSPPIARMCMGKDGRRALCGLLDLMCLGAVGARVYGRLAAAGQTFPAEVFVAAEELPCLLGRGGQPEASLEGAFTEAVRKTQSFARFWFYPEARAAYNGDGSLRGFKCEIKSALGKNIRKQGTAR
jgi:hypothetical protein